MRLRRIILVVCAAALLVEGGTAGPAAAQDQELPRLPRCDEEPDAPVCETAYTWNLDRVAARLDAGDPPVWRDRDALLFAWRAVQVDAVILTGGVVTLLSPISDDGLWGIAVRVKDLSKAVIAYQFVPLLGMMPAPGDRSSGVWRGVNAPPEPERAAVLAGRLETYSLKSAFLGETRRVTVYRPPEDEASPNAPLPVIYLTDGQSLADFAPYIDALVTKGDLPPLLLVGVYSRLPMEAGGTDYRAQEYLPDVNPPRYAAHEAFFMDEVIPWAEESFGASGARDDRALFGYSNGARFVLDMALKYPDRFGNVIAFSAAWGEPSAPLPEHTPLRAYLVSGTLETGFHRNTTAWADALAAAGDDVVFFDRVAAHDLALWREAFPAALVWTFSYARSTGNPG